MPILERVKTWLHDDEVQPSDERLAEYITVAADRLCLRLGEEELPPTFESIAVEVVIKLHRRQYYEGINAESAEGISTKFVDNILEEYAAEIARYWEDKEAEKKVVRFR